MANPQLEEIDAPNAPSVYRFRGLERVRPIFFMQLRKDDDDVSEQTEDSDIDSLTFDMETKQDKYAVFACYEQEAALKFKSPFSHYRVVAVGDGRTYAKFIADSGIKRGTMVEPSKMREILNGAFQAEFEVAKKNRKRRPKSNHYHLAGVSKDVENPQEIIDRLPITK